VIGLSDVPATERRTLMCVVTHNLVYYRLPLGEWSQPELRGLRRGHPCWLWTTREGCKVIATDAEVASVVVLVRMGLLRAPLQSAWAEQVRPTREALPLIHWLSDNGGWLP
jgi:hypothetical protein